MPNQQNKYQLLKSLEQDANLTQRQLSKELGISLGKVNYCLQGLIQVGLVKVHNFKNSKHKIQYSYLLTPKGVAEKVNHPMVSDGVYGPETLGEINDENFNNLLVYLYFKFHYHPLMLSII